MEKKLCHAKKTKTINSKKYHHSTHDKFVGDFGSHETKDDVEGDRVVQVELSGGGCVESGQGDQKHWKYRSDHTSTLQRSKKSFNKVVHQ